MGYEIRAFEETRQVLNEKKEMPSYLLKIEIETLKKLQTDILNNLLASDIQYRHCFVRWLQEQNNFIVTYQDPTFFLVQLILSDYSLWAEIEIVEDKNAPFKYKHYLILNGLTTYTDGLGIGKDFINSLKNFSNKNQLPIMLYCKEKLYKYYKKLGFLHKGYTIENLYIMYYLPERKKHSLWSFFHSQA